MKKKTYTSEDIQVLSDSEHVRKRTQIYLGNMHPSTYSVPLFLNDKFKVEELEFIPAVYKAFGEITDNSIDEFAHINQQNKTLSIEANPKQGEYVITDNGRGIPIDIHKTGLPTPEIVFGQLRSGRNFTDDKEAGVIGQNGVGSSVVAMVSTEFKVTIYRDNQRYIQTFEDGTSKISKPRITDITSDRTGTEISFKLDEDVFSDISLPEELIHNRAIEIAFNNPGITTSYNGQKYKFKKGIEDIIKPISSNYFCFSNDSMQFFVIFDINKSIDEKVYTYVNSSLLFDGGLCNTQFLNAFYDKTISHHESAAKREKCQLTKNDVRENLLVFGIMKIKNPEYDAQSKCRLTGPNLRKELSDLIDQNWSSFARKNKEWLDEVFQRAVERHHYEADKKAIKDHQKTLKRKIAKLLDATSKNRNECRLLITEGDSAKSSISESRDPNTTAAFALSGKLNNVTGSTVAQILQMEKLVDLLASIGLTPGKKASRSELRYGRIVIATDADYDGSDIFTLLINLFYTLWPELFDNEYEPIVYRLVAPNVVASKGSKRVHFATRGDYEKQKEKYRGWSISYMKGLGSLVREDWDMILSGETNTLIPVVDDGKMGETLQLLFGPSADARKTWLTTT